jgi:hypothetical protein
MRRALGSFATRCVQETNLTKGSLADVVCDLQFILPNLSHLYFAFNFNLVDVNF